MRSRYDQERFPGFEPQVNLEARNAFARVPNMEYFGASTTLFDYIQPEDAELELANPRVIRGKLFDAKSPHAIDGLVVSAQEYTAIPRNIDSLAKHVGARTLQRQVTDPRIDDERQNRSDRSESHALESKLPVLRNLFHVYVDQIDTLTWMKKEISHHWMAHANELNMRSKVMTTRAVFDGMITSIADSEKWDAAKRRSVDALHQKQLMVGPFYDKKKYWSEMVDTALAHTKAKRLLVLHRGQSIAKRVK